MGYEWLLLGIAKHLVLGKWNTKSHIKIKLDVDGTYHIETVLPRRTVASVVSANAPEQCV